MKVISVLLRAGADPNSRSFMGDIPISTAMQFGRQDIVRMLMAHCRTPVAASECVSGAQQSAADAEEADDKYTQGGEREEIEQLWNTIA
jgi:hypothetical protein